MFKEIVYSSGESVYDPRDAVDFMICGDIRDDDDAVRRCRELKKNGQ